MSRGRGGANKGGSGRRGEIMGAVRMGISLRYAIVAVGVVVGIWVKVGAVVVGNGNCEGRRATGANGDRGSGARGSGSGARDRGGREVIVAVMWVAVVVGIGVVVMVRGAVVETMGAVVIVDGVIAMAVVGMAVILVVEGIEV